MNRWNKADLEGLGTEISKGGPEAKPQQGSGVEVPQKLKNFY